ncbi:MAG: hypothetical protein NW701_07400 [Nitrospira sp.]
MRFDKKSPPKTDKKTPPKAHKKGIVGYNKKTALLEEAITHMNAGKYGRSSAVLKELLALDPLNTEARRLFATLHLRLGSLISARTAFESLAREALERQDYWLAESLLREYLGAGPRCVPFLDMLGQLYEAKGDSMAAVAEYGKAVDVLIEDPDTENPARAAELFQKIQSLAPGSPTAFRLAPLFDSGTGQLLAPPLPSNHNATADTGRPVTDPLPESNDDPGASFLLPSDPPEAAGSRIDEAEPPVVLPEAAAREQLSADIAGESPLEPIARQRENAAEGYAENEHPASAGPQAAESSLTSPVTESSTVDGETPFKLADETSGSTSKQMESESVRDPEIAVDATGFSLKPDIALPDSAQALTAADLSLRAVTNPIAEAPPAPRPMPWDQIQDTTLSIPRPAEDETQVCTAQDIGAIPVLDPPNPADDQPALPVSAESFLSSMSWEEILAAVGGGSSSVPVDPPTKPAPEDASVSGEQLNPFEIGLEQGPAAVGEPSSNAPDVVPLTADEPVAESQNLPAPMPWEQVEEEAVPILQHEPEPEYGVVPETTLTPFVDDTWSAPPSDTGLSQDLVPDPMPEATEALLPEPYLVATPGEASDPLPAVEELSCSELAAPEPLPIEQHSVGCGESRPLELPQEEKSAPTIDDSMATAGEQPPIFDAFEKAVAEAVVPDTTSVLPEGALFESSEDRAQDQEEPAPLPVESIRIESEHEELPAQDAVVESEVETPVRENSASPVDLQPLAEATISLESSSIHVEETAPAPDQSLLVETPQVAAESAVATEPAIPGDIKILWENHTLQPTPGRAGSNLFTRWLRRSKGTEESDNQALNENQPSGDRQVSNETAPFVASDASAVSSESSLSGAEISTTAAIDVLSDQSDPSIPAWRETPAQKHKERKLLPGRVCDSLRSRAVGLIGTCFSTTRSMTVTLFSLAVAIFAIGIAGIGAAGLAWILMEQRPNAAFYNLSAKPQRALQETSTNGYLALLGFERGGGRDPVQIGFERKFEPADLAMAGACLTGRGEPIGNARSSGEKELAAWQKETDPAARFSAQAASVRALVSRSGRSMTRYQQWLKMPFEDWGYGEPISPNCPFLLHVHRLYVADGFAQDVEPGIERLEADLAMWRTVLAQARTLPVKMLAADAIADDAAIVSGLLARPDLDEKVLGRLGKLVRPLDQVEQSLRWPMQSELAVAANHHDLMSVQDSPDSRPAYVSLAAMMPLPKQRRLNLYADYYEASGKAALEGRFGSFPKRESFIRSPAESWLDYAANPIENIARMPPLPDWETYGSRIFEVETRLRLAALQVWIRRSPTEQDVPTRMAKAGQSLYDPFTGFPMLVNRKKGLLYSVGQDGKDHDGQPGLDIAVQLPSTPGGSSQEGGKRGASTLKSRS